MRSTKMLADLARTVPNTTKGLCKLGHYPLWLIESCDRVDNKQTHAHSITSSALARRDDGTVRPRAFAVLRLIASPYLVGACTGKSPGLSPIGIPSTCWLLPVLVNKVAPG